MGIGGTPLLPAPRLAAELGLGEVYLKDDTRFPSSCAKDRATTVGLARAAELGRRTVACASTGNAASSLALLAANAGVRAVLFVPERAPSPKVAQLVAAGATVVRVKGTYDDAYDLSLLAFERFGWYSRNSGHNAFLVEGKKTAGLEIGLDLGWRAAGSVFVSVGDGSVVTGAWKGSWELWRVGLVPGLPRVFGIQAEGAAPIAREWRRLVEAGRIAEGGPRVEDEGEPGMGPAQLADDPLWHPAQREAVLEETVPDTQADSIAVGKPRDWRRALASVARSGGRYLTVPDPEILDAIRLLARTEGVFVEPACAAALAGLVRAVREGEPRPPEPVVVLLTGSGLKDPGAATAGLALPEAIEPDLDRVAALTAEG
jgi:threonine synthase